MKTNKNINIYTFMKILMLIINFLKKTLDNSENLCYYVVNE